MMEKQRAREQLAERIVAVNAHIGSQLRARRLSLGISEETLAQELGVSVRAVNAFESGTKELMLEHIIVLAKTLSVPPTYFYNGL